MRAGVRTPIFLRTIPLHTRTREREANALIGKRPDVLLASTSKLSDVAAALELSLGLPRANRRRDLDLS